ncbi:uncharacterized protein LOC133896080 isoform X2 [Phragmites australis]|uniref:uncharacterized protein LOC133896080 isoform X2 n=1 Tax=Phragmites australis TaxID=29695 RepID=UPI002D764C0C|nr:uncharacterized protein LOC133896080 isoform X2 [Phragmites australis]
MWIGGKFQESQSPGARIFGSRPSIYCHSDESTTPALSIPWPPPTPPPRPPCRGFRSAAPFPRSRSASPRRLPLRPAVSASASPPPSLPSTSAIPSGSSTPPSASSRYSIVCDLSNNESIERLRRLKGIGDSKPLSILCRSLRDIDTYTTGFPRGTNQGQANIFRAVKRAIPGPYTFILPATKQFPKQCIKHGLSTRYAKRRQVGVRIPDDPICQAILQNLEEPLICTSVKYLSEDEWILDPVIIADIYEPLGLDFIVDGGVRIDDPSTVVDMTGTYPTIIRQGKGPKLDWMETEDKEHEAQSMLDFKAA